MKVLVFAEADNGAPVTSTLELLTKARELGDVEAAYVGTGADALATAVGEYGATKLYTADPQGSLTGVVGAALVAKVIESASPDLVLFAQTYDGRDAISRLSARIDRPVLTNGYSVTVDGDSVSVGAQVFGGTVLVETKFTGPAPYLAAIRPKSFAAEPSGGAAAAVEKVAVEATGRSTEAKVLDHHVEERRGSEARGGDDRRLRWARHRQRRGVRPARRRAREAPQRREWCVARHRRRRLGAVREAGRPDRQDREAEALHRARHLRRHPAPRGHEGQRQHHRDQQGRRGPDLLGRRPRRRRRRAEGRPQAHRGPQGQELGTARSSR